MLTVQYAASDAMWPRYEAALPPALAALGLEARLTREAPPAEVDYLVYAPNGPVEDFGPFTRAKAVLSLWAGVERVVRNPTLQIPLTRMVDRGLAEGMVEYVVGHVLRGHLGMDRHICRKDALWAQVVPPLARDRRVTVLGLGALGAACAQALAALNFRVSGWSARPREIAGVRCLAGPELLGEALSGADILVTLLPNTPATENIVNAQRLSLLAPGAHLINPGRGALIDEEALFDALDTGRLGHATLDTFRTEPLPPEHPFWTEPKITVTPHVAAETRPESAAEVIAENIRRFEAGEPPLHLVDRARGY